MPIIDRCQEGKSTPKLVEVLCPQCGANLNISSCQCTRDEGDPRLAVLRGLSLQKD